MISLNINVNDVVKVRLTDRGRAIHREAHEAHLKPLGIRYQPPHEVAGWTEFQFHALMSIYGQHLSMSLNPEQLPFATEMRIDLK